MANKAKNIFTATKKPGLKGFEPSITQQHFANQVNINQIMAKYQKTGILPINQTPALYGDFSDAGDYQSARERLAAADAQFNELPSSIRDRFKNDPAELFAFISDDANREEAEEIGLVPKKEKPQQPVPKETGAQ